MIKWISVLLLSTTLSLAVGVPAAPPVAANQPVRVNLDGKQLALPVDPVVINDRTMVPFRAIAEALQVNVTWHDATRTVEAQGLGTQLLLTLDEKTAQVNGWNWPMDVAPTLVESRTLVPLRFFSEAFGLDVGWDGATKTVSLTTVRPMEMLAFHALNSYGNRGFIPQFNEVAFGWSSVSAEGALVFDQGSYYWPDGGEQFLAEVQQSGQQRYLMVGATDEDGRLTKLVLDPARRQAFAQQVTQAAIARGFEGVDLDLEQLGPEAQGEDLQQVRDGFTALVKAVADGLRPAQKRLILSIHPPHGWYQAYDYAALAPLADRLQLMAHDYTKQNPNDPEPMEWVEQAIRLSLYEQQIPKEKLLLGVVAGYESPETLVAKAVLAKRYGLQGISVWTLGQLNAEQLDHLHRVVRAR